MSTSYEEFNVGIRSVGDRTDDTGGSVDDLSAREDALINHTLSQGVVKPGDGWRVTADGSGMAVEVGSGSAYDDLAVVASDETQQPPYLVRLQDTSVTVQLDASGSQARTDAIYLVAHDDTWDGSGLRTARLAYRKGEANGGTPPGPDGSWHAYLHLADITVGAGVEEINQSNVTDRRVAAHVTHLPPGIVSFTAGENAPPGWVKADGQSLDRNTYWRLFSVIGTTFGGSGSNFNVPNVEDRTLVGAGNDYALAATFGVNQITQTEAQLAPHTHSQGNTSSNSHSHGSGTLETGNTTVDGGGHSHGSGSLSTGNTTVSGGGHSHTVTVHRSPGSTEPHRHGTGSNWDSRVPSADTGWFSSGSNSSNIVQSATHSHGSHSHSISGSTSSATHSHGSHSHSISGTTSSSSHSHTNPNTNSTGGGEPMDNRQPSMALTPIISV